MVQFNYLTMNGKARGLKNKVLIPDNKSDVPEKYSRLMVSRDENWVKATASKVKVLVEKMATLVTHSNFRVRQALTDWAKTILLSCMK